MYKKIKSPIYYTGNKYKLLELLFLLFPQNIDTFYDIFTGGGTMYLNVDANAHVANDLSTQLINLHKYIYEEIALLDVVTRVVREFNLLTRDECSGMTRDEIAQLNKESYLLLREQYNKENRPEYLLTLLIYSFSHIIRFNKKNEFNVPCGNGTLTNSHKEVLTLYTDCVKNKKITFTNSCFSEILNSEFKKDDFIYLDPPYRITNASYNENGGWSVDMDIELFKLLDFLTDNEVKWGMSNVSHYKRRQNLELISWMSKYEVRDINAHYHSHRGHNKGSVREVYIYNY